MSIFKWAFNLIKNVNLLELSMWVVLVYVVVYLATL